MNFNSSYNPSNNTFGSRGYAAPDFDEDDADYEEDEDADADADADGYDDENAPMPTARQPDPFMSSFAASRSTPRGLKRSRDGRIRENSGLEAIARGMTNRSKPAPLAERDEVVVGSEDFASKLDNNVRNQLVHDDASLTDSCAQLTDLWSRYSDPTTKPGTLGPASNEAFTKANYLATLLLQLHYPHTSAPLKNPSRQNRHALVSRAQRSVPVPQALLKWLDTYHMPFPDDFDTVHLNQPSPAAHESFWDLVFASALRGKLDRVLRLLKDAGWDHAYTALEDGSTTAGYTGQQLQNTEEVADHAIRLIESCPAVQYADWDVKNSDWTAFRQRVQLVLDELEMIAGGGSESRSGNMFRQSMEQSGMSLSTASRRAESRVPWGIYENLSLLYKLLLGSLDDILLTSQDWLEASIYLTVWWDGSDDRSQAAGSNKAGLRKSVTQKPREVDVSTLAAYRARLADVFAQVTDQPDDAVFNVNTMDIVEVGIACIMEDNVGSVVSILRTLSMPVAVSVVEIASIGGWLPLARPRSRGHLLGQGFSKEDLLVLSHGPVQESPQDIDRDLLMGEYADLLADKSHVRTYMQFSKEYAY